MLKGHNMIIVISFALNKIVQTCDGSPRHLVSVQSCVWSYNASRDDEMNALEYAAKEGARMFTFDDDEQAVCVQASAQYERELRGA